MKRILFFLISFILFAMITTSCSLLMESQNEMTESINYDKNDESLSQSSLSSEGSIEDLIDESKESNEESLTESIDESLDEASDTWQDENVDIGGWT